MSTHHEHPDVDCEVLADAMGPETVAPGSLPPPPPVRAARLFAIGDGWLTRLDALLERGWPRELNPLAQLGPATNAMLALATVSGVLLLIWYSASVQLAWHALADLGPRSLGGLVRSVHRYSSDLAMLLLLAHAGRTFLARKFADARWLAWASGIFLLGLVWFIGWTGYWLVWDERAQLLALGTMKAVDVLPIFGEPMLRLFTADHTVPSLLFFVVFFLHMVLPLGIAIGLCLHLARLSRAQLLPDWRVVGWLVAAVLAAALILPAANAAPAHMAVKPDRFTMDWWFLWPLGIMARLSGGGVWLAGLFAAVGLTTIPWWLARRRPRSVYQAKVNLSRCFSCSLCSHDCPFGAITMVARTDGKPFPPKRRSIPTAASAVASVPAPATPRRSGSVGSMRSRSSGNWRLSYGRKSPGGWPRRWLSSAPNPMAAGNCLIRRAGSGACPDTPCGRCPVSAGSNPRSSNASSPKAPPPS